MYHCIIIVVLGVMHNFFRYDHESNTCNCIGDTLTFECTVMTGKGTIWRGNAFNCASTGNEINLFNRSVGDQTCNGGMITGRVIKHERNNYRSQFNVVFSSDLIGRTIECASDNGSQIQSSLRTKDTLGTGLLSFVRRLSLSRRFMISQPILIVLSLTS